MKKSYIVITVIIVLYLVVTLVIMTINENNKKYLVLSPNTILTLKNGEWKKIEKNTKIKAIDTYIDGIYIGSNEAELTNNKLRIKSKNNVLIDLEESNVLGYTGSLDYMPFTKEEMTEEELVELNNILLNNGVTGSIPTFGQKVAFDLDNDGTNENFYFVSNLFEDELSNKMYSMIYVKDNNKIEVLYKKIEDKQKTYDMCTPNITNIIDINKKQQFNLVVSCEYFSTIGKNHGIISYEGNKYKLSQDL